MTLDVSIGSSSRRASVVLTPTDAAIWSSVTPGEASIDRNVRQDRLPLTAA